MFYRIRWIPRGGRTMYEADYATHASQGALEYAASIVNKCAVLHIEYTDDVQYPYFRKREAKKINGEWMCSLSLKK